MKKLFALLLLALTSPGHAVLLSTSSSANVDGQTFSSGEVFNYDLSTGTAAGFWHGAFAQNENIDALAIEPGGQFLLFSTTTDGQLTSGLSFLDGDLVRLDLLTGNASIFLNESLFMANEDINAAELLPSGNLLLSTTSSATLGGLSFRSGDIIEYDLSANLSSLFFSGDTFDNTENIDAIALLGNDLILSVSTDSLIDGAIYQDGDLIRYSPSTEAHSLFFSETIFSGNEDIDAVAFSMPTSVAVPVSSTLSLLIVGLFGIKSFERQKW